MLKKFWKLNFLLIRQQQRASFSFRNVSAIRTFCSGSKLIRLDNDSRTLVISGAEKELEYPFVWLRDNCQCPSCFHQNSSSRTFDWEKFDVNSYPTDVQYDSSTQSIKIKWNDNHVSEFQQDWLKARNFTPENQENYLKEHYRPEMTLWGKKDFPKVLKNFDFQKILDTDKELRDWLETLAVYGIAMIKNTPQTVNEARKIADRVGFIKKTHYGEEFVVQNKEDTQNVAYLSQNLQMHTDLPYYNYRPGTNLLHCLVQSKSKGGHNTITDGFYVAKYMQEHFPDYYQILTKTLVNWADIGREGEDCFHSIDRAPVIGISRDGNLEFINHSVPQRDSFFTVSIDELKAWYPAMAKFVELIHKEAVEFKTEPGDILTFNNIRLIHGRTEYQDTSDNSRHLIGAYLDWDIIYSRLRVLKKIMS